MQTAINRIYIFSLLFACLAYSSGAMAADIVEAACEIPLAYDVDVVVVGGSTRGVAAAVAAAEAGATVFLAAPRPYLGEDICATYRLWLLEGEVPTSELGRTIFPPTASSGSDLPFTYKANISSSSKHRDTSKPNTVAKPADKPVEITRVTTPMQAKVALDRALLDAKVEFLYGCSVTDILRDKSGRLAGIVMANRSGRQAVRAKVIIDATGRATTARLAGANFTPYPSGNQRFSRIVFGGTPRDNASALGISFQSSKKTSHKVYEYVLDLPMKDASWASFAHADQLARNTTWQEGQAGASEALFQVPPDAVKGRVRMIGDWPGAAQIDLDTVRPTGVDAIYVLGGCADVSRKAAAKLMRPVAGMALGRRVGAAAAGEAKVRSVGSARELVVACAKAGSSATYEIGEMHRGRQVRGSKPIACPARKLPVLGSYDVVVVGGGTGGAPAGIGAARAGAKTLIIEYLHGMGGVGTLGRITRYWHGNRVGFTSEIDKAVGPSRGGWNIEKKMEWFRSEFVKAGGDVWFLTSGCGAVMKGNRFVGVVVATPQGRGVVLANTVIDSTGNAVIPACAGLKCQEIGAEHISVQGTGLPPMTPGESYRNSDWTFCDDDDVVDMWRMMVVGKKKYAKAFDLGQLIDTRARRRIIGDVLITPMDIINKRTYPDVITIAKSNFDNHGFSSHTLFMVTPPDAKGLVANIPYRALMPKGVDGILVTGLGISAHGDAMPVTRMQPDVQNQGYAAGYAAAMAAQNQTTVRKIDVKILQKHLVKKKILPESVLGMRDSYPIAPEQMAAAVRQLGKDYRGITTILTAPKKALPALRKAYHTCSDGKEKLRYAHVLGMLYDDTGAETLMTAISQATWDKGWNFRGMGQFGASTSPLDNLIIALGRTKDKKGITVIVAKLKQLTPRSEFSHCRAVAIALEYLKDPKAAEPLVALLKKNGVSGHAFLEINDVYERSPISTTDNSTRNHSLRELLLARALFRCGDHDGVLPLVGLSCQVLRALFRCGDHDGVAEKILEGYSRDMRGLYAAHAKAILAEK